MYAPFFTKKFYKILLQPSFFFTDTPITITNTPTPYTTALDRHGGVMFDFILGVSS